jgi:hypothetical protein
VAGETAGGGEDGRGGSNRRQCRGGATKPSTLRSRRRRRSKPMYLGFGRVPVLGLEVELVGVDLGLGLGWWSGDLIRVGKGKGVRGRPGAVEDQWRWWLEQAGRRGGTVAPPAAGGGGRRLGRRWRRGRWRGRSFRGRRRRQSKGRRRPYPVVSAHGPRLINSTMCGAWSGTTKLEYRSSPPV